MFAPAVLRPFLVIASLLALLLLSGPPLGVKADGQPSPDDGTAAGPACGAVSGDEEAVAATRAAADEACDCSSATSHARYVNCVAGVTNQVQMPVTMTRVDMDKLKFSGSTSVKMTSFGIEPPTKFGAFSTGDQVKLTFEWLTARKAEAK